MARYVGLLDGQPGAYGIVIPDLPGCNAMGTTVEQAIRNAVDVMRDWADVTASHGEPISPPRPATEVRTDPDVAEAIGDGAAIVYVPLIRELGRPVKANLSLDSGVLAAIDAAAEAHGVTRSGMVELLAKRALPEIV